MELKDRKRSININNLTVEQAEEISQQIGAKAQAILVEAQEKINSFLNIYGMKAEIAFSLKPLASEATENNLNSTEQET